jgi:hypothetical protein
MDRRTQAPRVRTPTGSRRCRLRRGSGANRPEELLWLIERSLRRGANNGAAKARSKDTSARARGPMTGGLRRVHLEFEPPRRAGPAFLGAGYRGAPPGCPSTPWQEAITVNAREDGHRPAAITGDGPVGPAVPNRPRRPSRVEVNTPSKTRSRASSVAIGPTSVDSGSWKRPRSRRWEPRTKALAAEKLETCSFPLAYGDLRITLAGDSLDVESIRLLAGHGA